MADITLTRDERRTLSVLAFLFFRMGLEERAGRIYEALEELSEPESSDWRFAKAGQAAVAVEKGDGKAALAAVNAALKSGALSSKEATLHLIKAQALWLQGRKAEAEQARNQFLHLAGNRMKDDAR